MTMVIEIIGVSGAVLSSTTVKNKTISECQQLGQQALSELKRWYGAPFVGARIEIRSK